MLRSDEGNALADERGDDADDELVNGVRVKKRRDDLAAAHHPDILPGPLAEAFDECANRLRDEFDAGRDRGRSRASRKHVVHVIAGEPGAQLYAEVERLAADDLRIDGPRKGRQTIETLWSWPARQPIEAAVASGDEAIGARRDVDDDLPLLLRHSPILTEPRDKVRNKRRLSYMNGPAYSGPAHRLNRTRFNSNRARPLRIAAR